MKILNRISVLVLTVFVFSVFLFTSCKKDGLDINVNRSITLNNDDNISASEHIGKKVTYSILDNRVVIENSDDFELMMWALENYDLNLWENENSFNSYRTTHNLDEKIEVFDYSNESINSIFDDRELATIMNDKGILQINPYYIKIIPETRIILVMEEGINNDLYSLEIANAATENIRQFSFDDDVWYLLENGLETENNSFEQEISEVRRKKCKEKRARNKTVRISSGQISNGNDYAQKATLKLWYNRFGIWEKVKTEFINQKVAPAYGPIQNWPKVSAQINSWTVQYHFNERCGNTFNGTKNYGSFGTKNKIITVRSSKKPLERRKSWAIGNINYRPSVSPAINVNLTKTLNNF